MYGGALSIGQQVGQVETPGRSRGVGRSAYENKICFMIIMTLKWGDYETAFKDAKFMTKSDKMRAFRQGMNIRCATEGGRVEGFIFGIGKGGDKTTTNITEKYKMDDNSKKHFNEYVENINKDINEKVQEAMNSVVTNATVDVMTKSENLLKVSAFATNVVTIRGVKLKSAGDINVTGEQSNAVDIDSLMESNTDVMNEITTDISKKSSTSILDQMDKGEKIGEVLGGVVNNAVDQAAGVANNLISTSGDVITDAVGEVGGAFNNAVNTAGNVATTGIKAMLGAGTTTNTNTDKDTSLTDNSEDITNIQKINKNIKENKEKVNIQEIMESNLQNNLTNEFLTTCNASSSVSNAYILEKLDAESTGGNINISPTQKNQIKIVLKCFTDNKVVNDISTGIISDIENKVTEIFNDEGTIQAAGGAVAGAILAAGDATAAAAEGVGDGVSTAAQGVGTGVATAGTGLQLPLMVAAGVGVMLLMS